MMMSLKASSKRFDVVVEDNLSFDFNKFICNLLLFLFSFNNLLMCFANRLARDSSWWWCLWQAAAAEEFIYQLREIFMTFCCYFSTTFFPSSRN